MPVHKSSSQFTTLGHRSVNPAWLFVCLAAIGGGIWSVVVSFRAHPSAPVRLPPAASRGPYDPAQTPNAIAAFSRRVRDDKRDWLIRSLLAGYYLQRCRETGDIGDAVRAEQMARQSLALFSRANDGARDQLAMSLLTQHRFPEALRTVTPATLPRIGATSNVRPQTRLLRAEISLEMGDYDAADRELLQARERENGPNAVALWARLLEINGKPEQALEQMGHAQAAADANSGMPAPNLAWFHMRVGNILADLGRADEAERSFKEALAIFPNDYRTLTSLARLEAGRGNWRAVLDWGNRSAAIVPTPEVVALLGDAYSALGTPKKAEEQYALVETIAKLAKAQGAVYDRQRALFCADHGRNLDEALVLARRELQVRHDVYAYDTLAWVCTKKGLKTEAEAATAKSLSRGTQDARLFYHAGMSALAAGNPPLAREYLTRALRLNPYFLPFAPDNARALLAKMASK